MNKPIKNQDLSGDLDLFNCAHFFDAHEVLEDVMVRSGPHLRREDILYSLATTL